MKQIKDSRNNNLIFARMTLCKRGICYGSVSIRPSKPGTVPKLLNESSSFGTEATIDLS